jgi:hypothetical protein
MGFFYVLIILLIGFTALHCYKPAYYRLHRHEGQYLYLRSAHWGVRFLIAAVVLAYLVSKTLQCIGWQTGLFVAFSQWLSGYGVPASATMTAAVVLAFILAMMSGWIHRSLYMIFKGKLVSDHYDMMMVYSSLQDSPLDRMLMDAWLDEKTVMFHMRDRKVYVGLVLSAAEPSESRTGNQEVLIRPYISGYRDKDNLGVHFTTAYKKVEQRVELLIRQDEILSLTFFDPEVFHKINQPHGIGKAAGGGLSSISPAVEKR